MLSAKAVLFIALVLFALVFVVVWAVSVWQTRRAPGLPGPDAEESEGARHGPAWLLGAIGFVVNFFDTLGIGSFATTTSIFKLQRLVPDRLIPGTLNVGLALPTFFQALIYITIVEVDMRTLVLMIAAAVAGAWLGAGVVAGWSRRNVQIGMGIALLLAAALMLGTQLKLFPLGGDSLGVLGVRMAIALAGNFALGALMTLGIGLYAPCMILVSLLGMNPKVAFPIMMGSCAFLMPVGGIRFIRKRSFAPRASLWLALTGIPAVIIAAKLVRSLPLDAVRWLVVLVVVYTAGMMLRSAWTERTGQVVPPAPALDPTVLP
jgi:uncharacterized membrane protein YfcA